MENTNLINIFKQVKHGTKFKSVIHGDVTFSYIDETNERYPLVFWSDNLSCDFRLTDTGRIIYDTGECIIKPENGESWHVFHMQLILPTLKDGDFIVVDVDSYDEETHKRWISIYDAQNSSFGDSLFTYCDFDITNTKLHIEELLKVSCVGDEFMSEQGRLASFRRVSNIRKATVAECAMLRRAISDFGYKWNENTLALEEKNENNTSNDDCGMIEDDECKFKTFDKVLVRNGLTNKWEPRFFGRYINAQVDYLYETIDGMVWNFCIPYNENLKALAYTTFQTIV
jgi:hypothetical protein